jgi:hypothetical protein
MGSPQMPLYPFYPSKHGGMSISCEMWAPIATNKYVAWKLPFIPDRCSEHSCRHLISYWPLLPRKRCKISEGENFDEAHLGYSE